MKIEALSYKIEQLGSRANDVSQQVQCEEMQPGKKRRREVDGWLRNAQRKERDGQSMVKRMKGAGFLSSVSLAKEADMIIKEVDNLLEQGRFPQGLVLDNLENRGIKLQVPKLQGKTSKRMLDETWNCLVNEDIIRVGIYGMGGVGKTTLAMHINNRVLTSASPFKYVFWVTTKKETSSYKLQRDIAAAIGLDLSDVEEELARASLIYEAFNKKNKSLLILDDVWEPISVENIAVPAGLGACKLLITSRSISVCRKMNCKEFKLLPLLKEEAWSLFMDQLGNYEALSVEVKEISRILMEECDGLPLGIAVMARCMRGVYDMHDWRAALTDLRDSVAIDDMEDQVFRVLTFSFFRLNNERLKQCFLYCALYPEDAVIHRANLINHFIGYGLLDVSRKRHEQIDEGHSILNRLENACLLEPERDFSGNRYVKMHDLVRDMAINIMKKNGVVVKAGKSLKELPKEDIWSYDLTKLSLMDNRIVCIESLAPPMCPNLSVLLLQRNGCKSISNSFFLGMKGLKILDLSHTHIRSLPDSISELHNLEALFLQFCSELRRVGSLENLKKLREFDLSHTGIEEVPQGMENLASLRHLSLHGSYCLESFPSGTLLPRLSNLEWLMLPIEKVMVEEAEDVIRLKHLEIFQGCFPDLQSFNRYASSKHSDQLQCYMISVGFLSLKNYLLDLATEVEYHIDFFSNNTAALCFNLIPMREGSFLVPCSTENLLIKDYRSRDISRSLFEVSSSFYNAPDAKRCVLENYHGLRHIISSSHSSEHDGARQHFPFQALEVLIMICLPDFHGIFELGILPPQSDSFHGLKHLSICKCPGIKKLIPLDLLKHCLPNLQFVTVKNCGQMEEIFVVSDSKNVQRRPSSSFAKPDGAIIFTNLKKIWLRNLPALTVLCSKTIVCNSLQHVEIINCDNLERNPISIREVPAPERKQGIFRCSKGWWNSSLWDDPATKSAFMFLPDRLPSI